MDEMIHRVRVEAGERNAVALACEAPEDGIYESCRSLESQGAHTANGFVDRGRCRYPIREKELIGADAKRARHQRFQFRRVAVEDLADQIIESTPPAKRSVDELGREPAVGRRHATLDQGVMEREIGVGPRALDALDDLDRDHAGRRRSGGLSRTLSTAWPTLVAPAAALGLTHRVSDEGGFDSAESDSREVEIVQCAFSARE